MDKNFYPVCGDDYFEELYAPKEVTVKDEVLPESKTDVPKEVTSIQRCAKCTRQIMPDENSVQLLERVYHSSCMQTQVSNWIGR